MLSTVATLAADWPMHRGGPEMRGVADFQAPAKVALKWNVKRPRVYAERGGGFDLVAAATVEDEEDVQTFGFRQRQLLVPTLGERLIAQCTFCRHGIEHLGR